MERRLFLGAVGGSLALPLVGSSAAARPTIAEPSTIESYVTNVADVANVRSLPEPGTPLVFTVDHGRSYDPQSVLVSTPEGRPLGYLPRDQGRIMAALLSSGVGIEGRVDAVKPVPRPSIKLSITVAGASA